MIKKILPISVLVLVLVFVVLVGLQMMLGKGGSQGLSVITPTMVPGKQGSYNPKSSEPVASPQTTTTQMTSEELQKELPIVAPDFTLDRSDRMEKYVVSLKTDNGQAAYDQWLGQNSSLAPLLPPDQVIIAHQSVSELDSALDYAQANKQTPEQEFKKNTDTLLNIANTLFSPLSMPEESVPVPTLISTPAPVEKPQTNSGSGNYTYYAQCDSQWANYPLPIQDGTSGKKCTECNAGCGPTTAAMIISSYADSSQAPPKVVDSFGGTGSYIGCRGSGRYELYSYMSKVPGIKVSSIIFNSQHSLAKDVVEEFKTYIDGGWTIFVLADCKYGGHYFWVTDVTSDGKILAYDPAYGQGKPAPLNENQYDPYPYYIFAFGVRKS